MARGGGRLKGITIEIGGDTTELNKALKSTNDTIRKTASELKDTQKLLKLDPGNSKLLQQQQQLLQKEIEATKEKLKQEKEALDQVSKTDSAEAQEAQNALQREVVETTAKLKELEGQAKQSASVLGSQMQAAGDKIKGIGSQMQSVGQNLTTHVTVPIVGVGAASVAAYKEVKAGSDIVIKKTGATGKALEGLQKSYKNVAKAVPRKTWEEAAEAVGEVNTRFGVTGEELEKLSEAFLKYSDLNDTQVSPSIDRVQKVMEGFNIPVEQASALLDTLNVVGQNTGVSVDTLASSLSANAEQFQQMGMSAADAAEFIGQCEKSSIDVNTALMGLKTGMKNAAADGQTLQEALKGFSDVMNSNASDTEKLQAAYELFGSRAGAAMKKAFEEGTISFENFGKSIQDNAGNVETTFEGTKDASDELQEAIRQLQDIGADLGSTIMETMMPVLEDVAEDLKKAAEWFDGLTDSQKKTIVEAGLVVAALGPVIGVLGGIVGAVGGAVSAGGKFVSWLAGLKGAASATTAATSAAATETAAATTAAATAAETSSAAMASAATAAAGETAAAASTATTATTGLGAAISGFGSAILTTLGPSAMLIDAFQHHREESEKIKQIQAELDAAMKGTATTTQESAATTEASNQAISTSYQQMKDSIQNNMEGVKGSSETMNAALDTTKTKTTELSQFLNDQLANTSTTTKETVSAAMTEMQETTSTAMTGMQESVDTTKQSVSDLGGSFDEAKETINTFSQETADAWNGAVDANKTAMNALKTNTKQTMTEVVNTVKQAVTQLKAAMNFEWKLPHLKMPHIKISGSFNLDPPSAPTFSVEWYRKAMSGGMILDGATIFGAKGGHLLGGGEAGPEAIVGVGSLQQMIRNAVRDAAGYFPAGGSTSNYGGISINVYGAPGQDVEELADILEDKFRTRIQLANGVY